MFKWLMFEVEAYNRAEWVSPETVYFSPSFLLSSTPLSVFIELHTEYEDSGEWKARDQQ